MPAYDYQCPSCGDRKTVYRHYYLGDVIGPVCDKCGVEMERVYQAPAVHYKGSGFYVTDQKSRTDFPKSVSQVIDKSGCVSNPC